MNTLDNITQYYPPRHEMGEARKVPWHGKGLEFDIVSCDIFDAKQRGTTHPDPWWRNSRFTG
jgi:hypothetical protein